MESNKITIHQAFYGEVGRSHSCIKQTITDSDLTSFLLAFTDRPAALPPGATLQPYLSGSPYKQEYYILTKTFPDSTASRSGMVFTHVLVFNLGLVAFTDDLTNILAQFVNSTDNKNDELKVLQIDALVTNLLPERHQPRYIQQIISSFLKDKRPILFSGEIQPFAKALQMIWNFPNISLRYNLKFRTSFTPSDIENADDLTIVSIQKDFLSKWAGRLIINGEDHELVEITSLSESLFLGYNEENPFSDFLDELKVEMIDFRNFAQFEKLFIDYNSMSGIDDANIIRHDIRVLSKISPSQYDGTHIKEKFVERLEALIENKKDSNIKALRNIEWSAFSEGEKKGKQIVSHFIAGEIENLTSEQILSLSELVNIATNDEPKNWWHVSISDTISSEFKNQNERTIKNIWKLIDSSEATLKNLLSIFGSNCDCDVILRKHLPEKLRKETCKAFAPIAQKNNWYLLHADISLRHLSIELSLEKQLEIEIKLSLSDSVGVKYLIEKLNNEKLIGLALKTSSEKLIELSVAAIIKDVSLLKDFDLSVSGWLVIWTSLVLNTKKVFNGLIGKEQSTTFSVLDFLVKNKSVSGILIGLIADTTFSDISEYKDRNKVWGHLPTTHKEKFLSSTTKSILKDLLIDKIEINSIESEISDRITSDTFMSKFLSENRNDIQPVLTVYSSFNNLKDNFLADYISYYGNSITEAQARRLGNLVLEKKFSKSARSIYNKSRYNNSFDTANEISKELVSLNWWESIWRQGPKKTSRSLSKPFPDVSRELQVRMNLPTVVILTAINEEYEAVRAHLNEIIEHVENDTSYEVGIFVFNRREIAKVVIRECGAKNTTASQETERAIQYFKPDVMFFVGIAGSRKPNDFSIGDVIFPEKVYSYEGGKAEKEMFMPRPDLVNTNFTLYEIAKRERRKIDWKTLIKNDWNIEVKADLGVIASGEQLIEHYDSDIGKILTKNYNDTSAVEMEGFGFAKAANRQGRETSNMLIGIVRGISDILEQSSKKKKDKDNDRRPANAKMFASDTAAAFAFWLILKTYE